MKYLIQMMIIGGTTFLGEMLHVLIPLPVPASTSRGMCCVIIHAPPRFPDIWCKQECPFRGQRTAAAH